MTVSIRAATVADAAEIANLIGQLGYQAEAQEITARLTSILARSDHRLLVADVDGRGVGWLHATIFQEVEAAPFVVIAGLVVDSGHRRHGIGRRLMAEAEKWAKEQQCSVVRLWSSAGRTAAHRFYERLGYKNVKTQYSFVKSLGGGDDDFSSFVPRIDRPTAGPDVSES
jgi:GNAT superfamily N-acetyltransferase